MEKIEIPRHMWDNIKYSNIYAIGGAEWEGKKPENIDEEVIVDFLKFREIINLHIQEIQRTFSKQDN